MNNEPISSNQNNKQLNINNNPNAIVPDGFLSRSEIYKPYIKPKAALAALILSIIIAVFYSICFNGSEIHPQLSFSIFAILTAISVIIILKLSGKIKNPHAFIWLIPAFFVAICNAVFDLNLFSYGNIIVFFLLLAAFILSASVEKPVLDEIFIGRAAQLFFGNWFLPSAIIGTLRGNSKSNKATPKISGQIIAGVLIASPVLLIIIALLSSADQIFAVFIADFIGFFTGNVFEASIVWRCITIGIVFIFSIGYVFYGMFLSDKKKVYALPKFTAKTAVAGAFLGSINLLFLIFVIIQIAFLFTGGFMQLPDGIVYSEYAREGFFQLLFVTVINFSILLLFIFVIKDSGKNKLFRTMLLTLCIFTAILIASSFYRMALYVDAYGYTSLRLSVITFLVMESFLIITTILWFKGKSFNIVKPYIIIATIFYCIVNISASDYAAAKLNVARFASNKEACIDIRSAGIDGRTVIQEFLSRADPDKYIASQNTVIHNTASNAGLTTTDIDDRIYPYDTNIYYNSNPDNAIERMKHWQNLTLIKLIGMR